MGTSFARMPTGLSVGRSTIVLFVFVQSVIGVTFSRSCNPFRSINDLRDSKTPTHPNRAQLTPISEQFIMSETIKSCCYCCCTCYQSGACCAGLCCFVIPIAGLLLILAGIVVALLLGFSLIHSEAKEYTVGRLVTMLGNTTHATGPNGTVH
ncbi:uncharacterized protein LOC129768684 [Toxorhynchites rutilus septentrionalis]|uniref:uncharacterized protein LOC129768684 n=1 Tax=Toxorhynchites rutilus septentrionalis TaxID=329112 RepID=UPI002479DCDC|nr:uncharacterized protein LOC129768684 [Toxorhynchites rutilus septentrionalis]